MVSCMWCGYNHYGPPPPKCYACERPLKAPIEIDDTNSQKVKGILALSADDTYHLSTVSILKHLKVETFDGPVGQWNVTAPIPSFARPCPVRPRHGFVDSGVVKSQSEIIELIKAVQKADPKGEIIFCPPISADSSGIWTPSLLTVGSGNDGATAGKNVVSIPLVPSNKSLSADTLKLAEIGKDESPYVEFVHGTPANGRCKTYLTQLRAGPKVESISPDYIPFPFEVKHVVGVGGDLLEWEQRVAAFEEGTVVHHPGGSLTDHYAVHCRTHSIPLLTTREPVVGETLLPTTTASPSLASVLRGMVAADEMALDINAVDNQQGNAGSAVDLLLVGFHHSAAMGGDYGKFIGAAVSLLLRLGSIALRGEARHLKSYRLDRGAIYSRHVKRSLSFHRAGVSRLVNVFRYGAFRSSGYGGPKWAKCGMALIPLFNAVREFAIHQDEARLNALIRSLNTAVNQAHNGGWWLNKFCDTNSWDQIQKGNIVYVAGCARAALDFERTYQKIDPSEVSRKVAKWAAWPVTATRSVPINTAAMSINGANFQVSMDMRGFKGKARPINIPLSKVGEKLISVLGPIYAVPKDGRWVVQAEPSGKAPIVLWEEEAIDVNS